jgi:hypothetical protein
MLWRTNGSRRYVDMPRCDPYTKCDCRTSLPAQKTSKAWPQIKSLSSSSECSFSRLLSHQRNLKQWAKPTPSARLAMSNSALATSVLAWPHETRRCIIPLRIYWARLGEWSSSDHCIGNWRRQIGSWLWRLLRSIRISIIRFVKRRWRRIWVFSNEGLLMSLRAENACWSWLMITDWAELQCKYIHHSSFTMSWRSREMTVGGRECNSQQNMFCHVICDSWPLCQMILYLADDIEYSTVQDFLCSCCWPKQRLEDGGSNTRTRATSETRPPRRWVALRLTNPNCTQLFSNNLPSLMSKAYTRSG